MELNERQRWLEEQIDRLSRAVHSKEITIHRYSGRIERRILTATDLARARRTLNHLIAQRKTLARVQP